jgi:hypothetical protein
MHRFIKKITNYERTMHVKNRVDTGSCIVGTVFIAFIHILEKN